MLTCKFLGINFKRNIHYIIYLMFSDVLDFLLQNIQGRIFAFYLHLVKLMIQLIYIEFILTKNINTLFVISFLYI